MKKIFLAITTVTILISLIIPVYPVNAEPGDTNIVSVSSSGTIGNSHSSHPSISSDGRFISFYSQADNLVSDDTNKAHDVFVHDQQTGETERVSVNSDGVEGNASSAERSSITGNGQYVVFRSAATNLVSNDTNGEPDIFMRDRVNNKTTRISVASDGTESNNQSRRPIITPDGRFIVYESFASNLIPDDTNGMWDVYLFDNQNKETTRISIATDGTETNSGSSVPDITPDGRYIVFTSSASNLVPEDNNNVPDVFVHDRITGETEIISVDPDGVSRGGGLGVISDDGRFVAFASSSTTLATGETSKNGNLFLRDRQTRKTSFISKLSDVDYYSLIQKLSISGNGRFIAFPILTSKDPLKTDIYVFDRETNAKTLVSVASDGTLSNGGSDLPDISYDGKYVTFRSGATNFVDGDTNGGGDIFVHELEGGDPQENRPIIIIPGMTASMNYSCLAYEIFCDVDFLWHWTPTAKSHYESLFSRLAEFPIGYTEENGYINVFFYDWRKPIDSHINDLKDRINYVKEITNSQQVDIIGHSMGGLVARAYIQSSAYNGDVAHLVTLGSPHEGSVQAYPMWQAFYMYERGLWDQIPTFALMKIWTDQSTHNSKSVLTIFREKVPGTKDLLPIFDYLYDDTTTTEIPENNLIHRNAFLPELNQDSGLLFDRTAVATFNGTGVTTTEKFYVNPPNIAFQLSGLWDDGFPNFAPDKEFKTPDGDGTVLRQKSAELSSPAYNKDFSLVAHRDLASNNEVIDEIIAFLGLPSTPHIVVPTIPEFLVLLVIGEADLKITDPLGQILDKFQSNLSYNSNDQTNLDNREIQIPEAKYYAVDGEPSKLIMIPNPIEGKYLIEVQGNDSGEYELNLLDTFTEHSGLIEDPLSELMDSTTTITKLGATTIYSFNYTEVTTPVINLIAETPIIETPVLMGSMKVTGRALQGKNVDIFDASTNTLLGTGTTDELGRYEIHLSAALDLGQKIYPKCEGVTGLPVTVEAKSNIFLPLIIK